MSFYKNQKSRGGDYLNQQVKPESSGGGGENFSMINIYLYAKFT